MGSGFYFSLDQQYIKPFVSINGIYFDLRNISCGVSQGSILRPLLFILYVNDIGNHVSDVPISLYADDTNVSQAHGSAALC